MSSDQVDKPMSSDQVDKPEGYAGALADALIAYGTEYSLTFSREDCMNELERHGLQVETAAAALVAKYSSTDTELDRDGV